jgi:hypothetical protein
MKATELRIGNWVRLNVRPIEKYQVTQILEKGVNCGDVGFLYDVAEPIPLTEEWLERFGIMQNTWFEDGSYMIKEDRGFGWEMYVRNAVKTKRISFAYFKHVHQLQNLYFALTGEELQTDETDQKVNL